MSVIGWLVLAVSITVLVVGFAPVWRREIKAQNRDAAALAKARRGDDLYAAQRLGEARHAMRMTLNPGGVSWEERGDEAELKRVRAEQKRSGGTVVIAPDGRPGLVNSPQGLMSVVFGPADPEVLFARWWSTFAAQLPEGRGEVSGENYREWFADLHRRVEGITASCATIEVHHSEERTTDGQAPTRRDHPARDTRTEDAT